MRMTYGWDDDLAIYRKHALMNGKAWSISSLPVRLMPSPDPKNFITIQNDSEISYPCYGLPEQLRCLRYHYGQLLPGYSILSWSSRGVQNAGCNGLSRNVSFPELYPALIFVQRRTRIILLLFLLLFGWRMPSTTLRRCTKCKDKTHNLKFHNGMG